MREFTYISTATNTAQILARNLSEIQFFKKTKAKTPQWALAWTVFLSFALLAMSTSLTAQTPYSCGPAAELAQQRYWFFGTKAGLDFGTTGTAPVNSAINTVNLSEEGIVTATNSSGVLQFFAGPTAVYNSTGAVMANGASLLGSSSATQAAVAFQRPGYPKNYFLVTNLANVGSAANGNLYYHRIDMTQNGGLGAVTTKNTLLGTANTASEALAAVPNHNGTKAWVLSVKNSSNQILAYEFDGDGPTGVVVTSTVSSNNGPWFGNLRFSADMSKVVQLSNFNQPTAWGISLVRLFDFNAQTGQLTENWTMTIPTTSVGSGYGVDFSPNGNYIYVTGIGNGAIFQYDLSSNTGAGVLASGVKIGTGAYGNIRRAPDGKMYVANNNLGTISVINSPNTAGIGADFVLNGQALASGQLSQLGLPEMVQGCTVALTDTDTDGIPDVDDLDDDNDGILDTDELNCLSPLNAVTPTLAGATTSYNGNNVVYSILSGSVSKASPNLYNTPIDVVNLAGVSSAAIEITNPYKLLKLLVADIDLSESITLKIYDAQNNLISLSAKDIIDQGSYVTTSFSAGSSIILTAAGVNDRNSETTNEPNIQIALWDIAKRIEIYKTAGSNITYVALCAACDDVDTDKDGIPNHLDLDSDGDGCSDAVEGGASFTTANLVTSTMAGGNSGAGYTGTSTSAVTQNLGNTVGSTATTLGVPTVAGTGQAIGYSQNGAINACTDTDIDGVPDIDDLDDDNDGILDIIEDGSCSSLNIDGKLKYRYWQNGRVPANHDLLPMSGRGGTSAPNLFPVVDSYGLPDFSITPTITGVTTTWGVPAGTESTLVDALRFEGYMHFPQTLYGKQVKVRVSPSGNLQVAVGWVISKDNNPNNWVDPTSPSGEPLLDMKNTTGLTNPATGWTGPPVGFVIENNYGANSATPIPVDRKTPANWTVDLAVSQKGHYVSILIGDPLVSWNMYSFQYSTDGSSWVDMPLSSFGSTSPSNCIELDIDNDGIPNSLDLDSDGDGCSDAIEGGASFTTANLVTSTMAGGNSGAGYTGTSTSAVTQNLGNTVGSTATTLGVPTIAGTGQSIGNSQNGAVNGCTDTDTDGIPDLDDLDDDNDGILDTDENCTLPNATIASTYTRMTGNYSIANGVFENNTRGGTVKISAANVSGTTGLFETPIRSIATGNCNTNAAQDSGVMDITFSKSVTNAVIMTDGLEFINEYQDFEILAPYSGTPEFKILNSTLGATLIKLSDTKYRLKSGANCGNNANCPSSLTFQITGAFYSKIRLSGDDPVANSSCRFSKIGLDDASTNECVTDVDNDGIPNHLDLDSDGDGCPDAIEGGAAFTTSNTTSTGALSGSVSSATATLGVPVSAGTGQSIGDSQNGAINACTDTDTDGIPDLDDLDDDNDGILDITESQCFTTPTSGYLFGPTYWNSISWTGGTVMQPLTGNVNAVVIPTGYIDGNLIAGYSTFAPTGILSNTFYNNPVTFTLNTKFPLKASGFAIVNDYAVLADGIKVADIKLYSNNTFLGKESFSNIISNATSSFYPFSTIYENVTKIEVIVYEGNATANTPNNEMQLSEMGLYSSTMDSYCTDLDTDGDGTPNRLDLDSDGDGCPDAVEAGTTAITTSGVAAANKLTASVIPAPYGTNGFANGLETVTDNGTYKGTYSYNDATNALVKGCTDTDTDGIPDVDDLDDDNDGILDSVECPAVLNLTALGMFGYAHNAGGTSLIMDNKTGALATNINPYFGSFVNETLGAGVTTTVINTALRLIGVDKLTLTDAIAADDYSEWAFSSTTTPTVLTGISQATFDNTNSWKVTYMVSKNGNAFVPLVQDKVMVGVVNGYQLLSTPTLNYYFTPGNNYRIRAYYYGFTGSTLWLDDSNFSVATTSMTDINGDDFINSDDTVCDTDGDGIPNTLDLDSDGDGCSDAIEGGGSFTAANTAANGALSGAVSNAAATLGVPTVAGSGQTIGSSQNAGVKDAACFTCPTITNTAGDNTNPSACGTATGSVKICGLTANGSGITINYDKNGTAATALTNQTADASGCITITGLTAGAYTNIKISSTACPAGSNALSATLTDPTGPSAPTGLAGVPSSGICVGTSVALSATGTTGATYTWTVSPTGATLASAAGTVSGTTASNTFNSTAAGTYTVSLTQTISGCTSAPATTSLTVNATPSTVVPTATSKSNVCPTTTVDLTSLQPAAVSGVTYEWHTVASNPTSGTLVATPAAAASGTYYLYGKSASGCYSAASSAVTATVNACIPCTPVDPGVVSGSAASIKTGNTASFTLTGATAGTTTWAIFPSNGVSPNAGTGTSTGLVTFNIAGEYQVLFSTTNSSAPAGCSEPSFATATGQFTVEAPLSPCAKPSASSVAVSPTSAAISEGATASFTMSGGTPNSSVQWVIIPSTGVSPSSGTGTSTGSVTFATKGLYTAVFSIVNLGDGSCAPVQQSSSAPIAVGLNPCSPPTSILVNASTANQASNVGQSVTFTATGGIPGVRTWTVTPATGANPSSGTGSTATITFTNGGIYSVVFTSKNSTIPLGCTQPVNTSASIIHNVSGDTDGDGVSDAQEAIDGTNPNDGCSYNAASQVLASTSAAWKALDCDNDGTPNGTDAQPKNPCVPNANSLACPTGDTDGDGVTNAQEAIDGTNPSNGCSYNVANQVYANTSAAWKALDCDNDGLMNGQEVDPNGDGSPGPNGTNPNNPDTDGDGVTDGAERTTSGTGDPLTNANDGCSYNQAEKTVTPSAAWAAADCDNDGTPNGTDSQPLNPCVPNANSLACPTGDTDGDGVTNGQEAIDGTNPSNGCSYNVASQVPANTSAAWKASDCDNDGNTNGTDPNPLVPVATNDMLTAPQGVTSSVNVLTNDDFLPGAGTSLTVISGGTATGTATFNPLTGMLSYVPAPGETGLVTLRYRVCNTVPNPDVCAEATVSITISATNAKLNLKVLLQGALLPTSSSGGPIMTGIMRDDLRTASPSQIPNLEPYTGLANSRFTHVGGGGETMGAGVLSAAGNDAIVDWVFVELRDKNNPATVLKTRSALVQRDGDVVESTDGISPLTFTGAVGESYYVSVKHRNHLGAMTAGAIAMTATGTLVDFTTMTAAQTYHLPGYDGFEQVDVNGKMALWAGNTNADKKVKYVGVGNDQIPVFGQAVNYVTNTTQQYNFDFATPVYLSGDINMDAKVKYRGPNNDTSFIFFNVITKYALLNTGALYNYDLFIEQLP